jgi:hypothetical protein
MEEVGHVPAKLRPIHGDHFSRGLNGFNGLKSAKSA